MGPLAHLQKPCLRWRLIFIFLCTLACILLLRQKPDLRVDLVVCPDPFNFSPAIADPFIIARSSRPVRRNFYMHVHSTRKCTWLSESIINTGSVEEDILDIIEHEVHSLIHKRGDDKPVHFVDIGANIGFITLFAAALHANVYVTSVEAMPWHFELLDSSLRLNPALSKRIKLFRTGLGPNHALDALCMVAEGKNAAATSALPGKCKTDDGVTVPVEMLDDVLAKSWQFPPDVLKIDVEGFESLIFDGATRMLKRPPSTIVAEYVPFRVRRAVPDMDPYVEFFKHFPADKFTAQIVNPKAHGIAVMSGEETLQFIKSNVSMVEGHHGCNIQFSSLD